MQIRSLKQSELRRYLKQYGFELDRQSSHLIFKNAEGKTISLSASRAVSLKTLQRELRRAGVMKSDKERDS